MGMRGRILAIGDIHGCSVSLALLLKTVRIQSADIVVVLGDLIDRGPDSCGVIEQLLELSHTVRVIGIFGNHEEMLLQSVERGTPRLLWLGSGARATLDSYGGHLTGVPDSHLAFLRSFVDYWETETHIFVHGNAAADEPVDGQSSSYLRWAEFNGSERPHCSGKTIVCGHTGQERGLPAHVPGYVCIDTQACCGQWLTCLDVDHSVFWQASESGEIRGPLSLDAC